MIRLLPTLGDLLGVFLAIAVFAIGSGRLFGDSDPAMHVATGRFVLEHHRVPHVDPFSATYAGQPWFAHEWLADVGWALVHRAAGWQGLTALSAILIAGAHVILYRYLVRRGDHPLAAFLVVVAAAVTSASHWLARPHLLTVFLLVIWVAVLERVVEGRGSTSWLFVLPPLLALWANLHGGFLVALPVLGCYLLGDLVTRRRAVAPLGLTLLACAIAVLINPYGWGLPRHLLGYFAAPRPALGRNVEFAPASIGDRAGIVLFAFLALCVAALACEAWLRSWRSHPGTVLAFVMTAILAFTSIRHAEVAAVLGALVAARGFSLLLPNADAEALRAHESRAGGAAFGATCAGLVLLAAAGVPARAGYDPARFPISMVAALRERGIHPEGPVFSRDLWGGYLVLEWPEARVFIDGRSDMYGDAFVERYADVYEARAGWNATLADAGVTWSLLPRDAPLAAAMGEDPSWRRFAADGTAVTFCRVDEPACR
jgi:hypothetical protein